jgi:phosphatidylglycerophosphate synthase
VISVLDRFAIALLAPSLDRGAEHLARRRVGADQVTVAGFLLGIAGAAAISQRAYLVGLALILISRICDGLDGALARRTRTTDRGAYLDITLDFIFYAIVPLAFAIAQPAVNALPAAVLLTAFIGTGSTFLAFAALAAQRGIKSVSYPTKGIYYLGGLTEATETMVCFVAMCLWPDWFAELAYAFAGLCALTIVTRLLAGWRALPPP